MIGIIRYLKGYVKIKVWGYSPERFMNLCTNRGIVLWGLSGYGGYYTMYISLSDFFTIRDIVKKTKTRVAVLEKHGLPFFMRDLKKRRIFALGLILCLAFLLIMPRFIWSIQLEGNQIIPDDELITFLKDNGVDYGAVKSGLDVQRIEEAIRTEFEQVTWASIRLDGAKITVAVKENDLPVKEDAKEAEKKFQSGADLAASKAGTVYSVLTRKGIPQIKAGDEVKKGDILIGGMIPVYNDDGTVREWEGCIADGDVLLTCYEPVRLTQKLFYQYKNYTGNEKKYRFFTFLQKRYRFPFSKFDALMYDELVEEKRLLLFGQIDTPIFYGTISCREYFPVDAVYEESAAAALLQDRLVKIIKGLEEKGVQIMQKDVTIVRKKNALVLEGNLTVLEKAVYLKAVQTADEKIQTQTP